MTHSVFLNLFYLCLVSQNNEGQLSFIDLMKKEVETLPLTTNFCNYNIKQRFLAKRLFFY